MAFLQLQRRMLSSASLTAVSTCTRLSNMAQCKLPQNYPNTCLMYSTLGSGVNHGKSDQLKFRVSAQHDYFLCKRISGEYVCGSPCCLRSKVGDGLPFSIHFRNIFTFRGSRNRLGSPCCEYPGRRYMSVGSIKWSKLPEKLVNMKDSAIVEDEGRGEKGTAFTAFHRLRKQAKPLAVRSGSLNEELQVASSDHPFRKNASDGGKLHAIFTKEQKPNNKGSVGRSENDAQSTVSVTTELKSSKNDGANDGKGKKKKQLKRQEHKDQHSGASASTEASIVKDSKRGSLVKKLSMTKVDHVQSFVASESECIPVAEPKKLPRNKKPQKKVTVPKNPDKIHAKHQNGPVAVEVKKSSSGKLLRPLYPPSGKSVIVVESVAKAKVIQGYLGDMYEVLPSYGHVRDLAGRSGSVRPDDDFSMVWEVPSTAWTHLKSIKVALNGAENLILASDPDREGEAIAWHITEMLRQQDALHENMTLARVAFHEITESSIKNALQTPRDIDVNLVHAYLARRALDYLIGFSISPLLWRKLPGCQSAGRVQSAALALICDREIEIDEFKPQHYWTINVQFNEEKIGTLSKSFPFTAHLTHLNFQKLEQFSICTLEEAKDVELKITSSRFEVLGCKRSKSRRNPPTPYITSTLQQDAANKLHFATSYTMKLAQKLYEGIKLSDAEATGLITYMRTDGLHIADEAAEDIRALVVQRYGQKFAAEKNRKYFKKVKNAQEAHEAIRPTSIRRLPSTLAGVLDEDSLKLYSLIWSRTMACQMEPVVIDQVQVDSGCDGKAFILRSTCSVVEFPGYHAVYKDAEAATAGYNDFNEAFSQEDFDLHCALKVKKLEELGIGRPSTYASTIKVLKILVVFCGANMLKLSVVRNVIAQINDNHTLHRVIDVEPLKIGQKNVSAFLSHHFSEVMDYSFTADMENEFRFPLYSDLDLDGIFSTTSGGERTLVIGQIITMKDAPVKITMEATQKVAPSKIPMLDNVSTGITEWKGLVKDYWSRFKTYCDCASKVEIRQVEKMLEKSFGDFLFAAIPDKSRICPRYIAKMMYGEDEENETPKKDNILTKPKVLGVNPGSNEKQLQTSFSAFHCSDSQGQLLGAPASVVPKSAVTSSWKRMLSNHFIFMGLSTYEIVERDGQEDGERNQVKDVDSVTLEQALELLQYPITLGKHPLDGAPVSLTLSKKHGLFSIKHRRTRALVPKKMKPDDITLEKALKLLSGPNTTKSGRPVNRPKSEEVYESN
ncbi:hypothetical protein Scep_016760 [Stephania cephalantha]|uniref:DNA topoisomerase n=1 Tax=Stephania cephalantha TaxID=152367 RepID=A0AAP0IQ73_9MAGN